MHARETKRYETIHRKEHCQKGFEVFDPVSTNVSREYSNDKTGDTQTTDLRVGDSNPHGAPVHPINKGLF